MALHGAHGRRSAFVAMGFVQRCPCIHLYARSQRAAVLLLLGLLGMRTEGQMADRLDRRDGLPQKRVCTVVLPPTQAVRLRVPAPRRMLLLRQIT